MELKGKKINFLGDSITEGVGASAPEYCYAERMRALAGIVPRNYGIGGTRIAKQRDPRGHSPSFNRDFCGRYRQMDKDADIVVVFGGSNDYGHGDAPFGDWADETSDTFLGALNVLFKGLKEEYPNALAVAVTPLPRTSAAKNPVREHPFGDYVAAVRQAAIRYGFALFDANEACKTDAEMKRLTEECMPDGLHPNDEGYLIFAKALIAFFRSLPEA